MPIRGNVRPRKRKEKFVRKKKIKPAVKKGEKVDYKDVMLLRKYLTERGKIIPRRITGNTASCQRELSLAVKRARFIALIPYVSDR